ncbi:MAG: hypothetical protein IKS40_04485 [Treponema sp.]|nr:hypothetical protein [Treponema sp.]
MKKHIFMILTLFSMTVLFAASFEKGARVYVADKSAKVKSSTSIFASTVTTVAYGDVCTVLESKSSKTQVQVNGKTGWISNSSLTTKKIDSGDQILSSIDNLALAGKGLKAATEEDFTKAGKKIKEDVKDATEKSKDAAKEAGDKAKSSLEESVNAAKDSAKDTLKDAKKNLKKLLDD